MVSPTGSVFRGPALFRPRHPCVGFQATLARVSRPASRRTANGQTPRRRVRLVPTILSAAARPVAVESRMARGRTKERNRGDARGRGRRDGHSVMVTGQRGSGPARGGRLAFRQHSWEATHHKRGWDRPSGVSGSYECPIVYSRAATRLRRSVRAKLGRERRLSLPVS
jgi:hypothetical protein